MGTWKFPIDDEEDGYMIRISIPTEDMAILQEERYTHPHPRVQRKLHTLYLVGLGYSRHDVARIATLRDSVNPRPKSSVWEIRTLGSVGVGLLKVSSPSTRRRGQDANAVRLRT